MSSVDHPDTPVEPAPSMSRPWMKWTLGFAAAYNLLWGGWVILYPDAMFDLMNIEPPRYPEIWQCVGMIVGCYGIAYAIAAFDAVRWWPIVLVGLLGKVFGPIGFVQAVLSGSFPLAFGWTIITNDLIWWLPFGVILYRAWQDNRGAASLPFPRRSLTGPLVWGLLATSLLAASPAVASDSKPLETVDQVNLQQYMGDWYEIARYPNVFQDGIVGVIARYSLRDDGKISVTNIGYEQSLDGDRVESTAVGWAVNASNTKWKVQFLWPFKADYWVIDLHDEYEYAVVGQPNRKNLWILSRSPQMRAETYEQICNRLKKQGYDPAKLQRTPQPSGDQ